MTNSTWRDPIVSMVRGMAIILVVIGHSLPSDNWVRNYIYMFHVPLFFFVSGYCFKDKYLGDGITFVKHRLRGLWWPFVKYGVPMVLLHNVFCSLYIYGPLCDEAPYTYIQMGIAVLKQFVMSGAEPLLGAYWFLNTLFGASMLFYGIHRLVGSRGTLAILMLCSVVCLALVPHFSAMRIVFRMFFAGAYMALGRIFSEATLLKDNRLTSIKLLVVYAVAIAIGQRYLPYEMTSATIPTMLPSILVALMGIMLLWGLCQRLNTARNRTAVMVANIQAHIGNHTLPILTWHFLSFKAVTLLIILIYGMPIEQLAMSPIMNEQAAQGWWIVYAIAGVSVVALCRK